jgi:hypothetical protein
MKELYSQWLRIQCEVWMKENLPELSQTAYTRISRLFASETENSSVTAEECLISQIDVPVGPWKSVFFHFKEPGEVIYSIEKCNLSYLREQGNLVLIIRCLEDFKTLIKNYFGVHLQHVEVYAIKSA